MEDMLNQVHTNQYVEEGLEQAVREQGSLEIGNFEVKNTLNGPLHEKFDFFYEFKETVS